MNKTFALGVLLQLLAVAPLARAQNQQPLSVDSLRFKSSYPIDAADYYSPGTSGSSGVRDRTSEGPDFSLSGRVSEESLRLFGIDLFDFEASLPASSDRGSEVYILPPSYKLGPGDRLGIFLLGKVQENIDVNVNIEGKIFVPPGGVVHVSGLSIDELKKKISQALSKYYDNFQLDVMILQPKNVMVAVVGEVRRPGKYVLSAMHTAMDAIVMAGGPNSRGSIRDIQLLRNGEKFAAVDLYQFLMMGENDYDVFLETGDRVYVPLRDDIVSIQGEVRRPALFELKPNEEERLTDLLTLAGGFTEYAYLPQIEVSRLKDNGERQLFYVDYQEILAGDSTNNLVLSNEDRIHVYSVLEQIHNREVAIYGEVRYPGSYPLEDNMRLKDLILKAGNLTRKAFTLEAEVAKVTPGEPSQFIKVNLQQLDNGTNGDSNITLEEDDQVFIRQIPEWQVGLTVEVRGEVKFPGKYPIVKDQTYLSEVLSKTGGFTEDAFLQEALVIRSSTRLKIDKEFERLENMRREEMTDLEYQYLVMKQNTADVNHIVVDFEKLFYENDRSQDIILEDGDIITIPKAPRVVTVTGGVAKPGGITFVEGARLDYYIARAGGASWDAAQTKTKVIKVTGEVLNDEDVSEFEPGDIVWVPRKADKKFWPSFLQGVTVAAQLASIYLVIVTAINLSNQ